MRKQRSHILRQQFEATCTNNSPGSGNLTSSDPVGVFSTVKIRMANPLYIQILKNGPFTPMVRVEESTDGDMVIPAHYAPKDPSEYTEPEKEKVSLDSDL
ncbi:hypothetical protein AgCh_024761 [Apium graveolens]